jgi:hypothetical protein
MIFGCIITLIFAPISFGLNTGFIEYFAIKNNDFCTDFCSTNNTSNDFITGEKMLVKMYAKMTVKVIVKHI